MNTYFIRHTEACSITQKERDLLWDDRTIAVHYEDRRSVAPKDYSSPQGQRAVRIFNRIATEGGCICAVFHGQPGCLVGIVRKGSSITIREAEKPDGAKKKAILKTLPLSDPRVIPPHLANRMLIGQPQQGTISAWHIIGDRVKQFVEHGDLKLSQYNHLLPYEQEIMCAEFLRIGGETDLPQLAFLSAPVGKTREAVDVSGVTAKGKLILAQVTHCEAGTPEVTAKLESLREVGEQCKAHMVLFCRIQNPELRKGIQLFPIERVFTRMKRYSAWRAAIGAMD